MFAFDEQYYLETYPDVLDAVRDGVWQSGFSHFAVAGRSKGRVGAPTINEDWYVAAYPLVREELASGKASSPSDHYYRIGRFRGYIPHAGARRPENPAAMHARSGGLWPDVGNALDIVDGRLDLGMINEAQATLLRKWINDGYVVLPNAIPEEILQGADRALDDAYNGRTPGLRYSITGKSQNCEWAPEALTQPAKALDIHWFSEEVRHLVFAPAVLDFIHLIFERRALATQTLGFWRGSAQSGHQDSAYVNYSIPLQFCASWIALEDVHRDAGELFYYVGSHRMPEFFYAREFKGAEVAKHCNPGIDLSEDYKRHIDLIRLQALGLGMPQERFLAKRGDVLIWHADLAHGGSPISKDQTRKSIVTHYCPKDCVPAYFEARPGTIRSHEGKAFYSSTHYGKSAAKA